LPNASEPGLSTDGRIGLGQPAAHRGRVLLQGAPLGPLGAEPPATQIPADRGPRQPPAIALGDQLGDRIRGPQKPRQAKFVWGRVTDQGDDLLLLLLAEGRLLAWTATATLLSKPCPAILPIASDPPVDRVVVDPEHPRGLGLSHPVQNRLDCSFAQRRLRCGWQ
jgi:hypothetical protein